MSQILNDLFKKQGDYRKKLIEVNGTVPEASFESQLQAAGVLNARAPAVDMSLYKKMMAIDPGAARTFIQTRLDNIEAQITPLREEMRQLKEIISYDKNKEISSYYEKTHKIGRTYGLTAIVNAYLIDNIGKEFRANEIYNHLKSTGTKVISIGAVSQILFKLCQKGCIKNPYRGVYVMEKKDV